jgi:putative tryptophan/tyrosine transport system substrate-binding protein
VSTRRNFITLLGGAAAWPFVARAQPGDRLRRVGILMPYPENEPDIQARVRAFKQELQGLGWIEGSKIEFDERWATDNMELVRSNAARLLERKPDAVIAIGGRVIPLLKQMTRSVPIVVAGTGDPLGTGMVTSLAHPGENITGFSLLELSIIGKFLELLKQMAPNVSRVSLIFNPDNPTTPGVMAFLRPASVLVAVGPKLASLVRLTRMA